MDLTTMLSDILKEFAKMSDRLIPVSLGLLGTLFMFEIVVTMAFKKDEDSVFRILATRIALVVILATFINTYESWTSKLYESFIWLSGEATGQTPIDPSGDLTNLLIIGAKQMYKILEDNVTLNPVTWIYIVFYCVGMIVFLGLVLMIFVIWLEYGLMIGLGILFIPFIVFSKTRWMGEKVWSIIYLQNVRIFFIMVLYNFLYTYLSESIIASSIESIVAYLAGLSGIFFMVLKAPQLASGIASGTPQLDLSSATASLSNSKAMAGKAATMVKAASAKSGLTGAVKTGASAGASAFKSKLASFKK